MNDLLFVVFASSLYTSTVVHVIMAIAPLQIGEAIICLVFVFVVDLREIVLVWEKGLCDKSVKPFCMVLPVRA